MGLGPCQFCDIASAKFKLPVLCLRFLRCKDKNMALRKVVAFVPTSKYYFGFLFNIRFGKHLGIIDVKAEKDGA